VMRQWIDQLHTRVAESQMRAGPFQRVARSLERRLRRTKST
jgi:hypothetical protein